MELIAFLNAVLDEREEQYRHAPDVYGWELRDIESKRRMLALHSVRSGTGGDWDTDPPAICNDCSDVHPCGTLQLLAEPHNSHADYRQEWEL